jgi:copper chaperone
MTSKTYHVPGISCGHCTATIEKELKFVEGVSAVQAEIASKRVTVEVESNAVLAEVESTLAEIGYPVAPAVALS